MGSRGRPTARITLSEEERQTLERWERWITIGAKPRVRMAERGSAHDLMGAMSPRTVACRPLGFRAPAGAASGPFDRSDIAKWDTIGCVERDTYWRAWRGTL